jgi:hypothetical protein
MPPPLLRRPVGRFGLVLLLALIGGFAGLMYGVTVPPQYIARAYVVTSDGPPVEITARSGSATHATAAAVAAARALAADGSAPAAAAVPTHLSSPDLRCDLVIGTSAGLLAGALSALLTLRRPGCPRPGRRGRPDLGRPATAEGHLRVWRAR